MKYISRFSIQWVSLLFLLVETAAAQTVHIAHCMAGCPASMDELRVRDNDLVVRHLFAASINSANGLADWQAYRVLAGSVGVASLLPRAWYEDSLVSGETQLEIRSSESTPSVESDITGVEARSYRLSEIELEYEDQGRLVPMSSFAGTPYWSELNYLSNLAQLPSALRLGAWSRLDQAVNALANEVGEVYVLSGPLYAVRDDLDAPTRFFKAIGTADAFSAFVFPSDAQQHIDYCDYRSSLEGIEAESSLTLYPLREQSFEKTLDQELGCH